MRTPTFSDDFVTIHHGNCLDVMRGMEPNSVDSIVTDPPYGLSFMGRDWDHGVPGEHFWREALRVAKPGAHLVAFGGTRTHHRLMVAIEDAGWEIRDCLGWLFGSGFPKSLNLDGAHKGWGTALKPAYEPIILARKPLGSTVAVCVQKHGTGALNIDGCRVAFADEEDMAAAAAAAAAQRSTADQNAGRKAYGDFNNGAASLEPYLANMSKGRWPANIVHDGSPEVLAVFPQTGAGHTPSKRGAGGLSTSGHSGQDGITETHFDAGSSARFFYTAKATTAERDDGLFDFKDQPCGQWSSGTQSVGTFQSPNTKRTAKNTHPTVKPLSLMRWLVRLVTPPGGIVLDPFMGSGTTLKAARAEGHTSIGIDLDATHCEIGWGRLSQGVLL